MFDRNSNGSYFTVLKATEGGLGVKRAIELLAAEGIPAMNAGRAPFIGYGMIVVPRTDKRIIRRVECILYGR